jgi:glycosyltransferase involved in cell wall biosynthesis
LARQTGKPTIYDIDDLVFDTKFTDQLSYTQSLKASEKQDYDKGVKSYGRMLAKCDLAMTSTGDLQLALQDYKDKVILNRNVLSQDLLQLSQANSHKERGDGKIRLGYFSGSITHNENFELIKEAIKGTLATYPNLELHLVGHLDLPEDLTPYQEQITCHPYVDWTDLPALIASVDINLAPLVDSTFNRAKSEIKWLEAAAVKVPTLASKLGAFEEMIEDGRTGLLADPNDWFDKLSQLIEDRYLRAVLAEQAYEEVVNTCTTATKLEGLD